MKIRKAVIPAAGLGTRMLPATKTIPKEMLPLLDKPVIQYIIEEAAAAGIEDILLVTNRSKSAMDDYFDYFPELEQRLERSGKADQAEEIRRAADLANIFYVRQKETKGLGHAIYRAKRFIGNEPFAVLLGDDVMFSDTPVIKQLMDVSEERGGATALGVQAVSDAALASYSSLKVAETDKSGVFKVEDLIEKPTAKQKFSNYAILGRYVLTGGIFNALENIQPGYGGEIQLTDGIRSQLASEAMYAVDFEGKRYDTGNQRGFLEATVEFALRDSELGAGFREYLQGILKA
ncbi:MAG: UTP--glucose-1-phosphate uridylyltransferase GalU [Oscillospiraceae bacterium]|jgi:UTP--glucose-1-phosphate uridylyltransferase|nr:UTP--glucose-1-phosphate uridylyltransferase GalU [Oscillospiraceae bacterium]